MSDPAYIFSADNILQNGWASLMTPSASSAINTSGTVLSTDDIIANMVSSMKSDPKGGDAYVKSMVSGMTPEQENPSSTITDKIKNFIGDSGLVVFGAILIIIAIVIVSRGD